MDPSTSPAQPQPTADAPPRYLTRPEIRGSIFSILLRRSTPGASASISSSERLRAFRQTSMLEEILYSQASCLEEYQDLSTLEDRVFKAGWEVCANSQRLEMERESRGRATGAGEPPGGGRRKLQWRFGQTSPFCAVRNPSKPPFMMPSSMALSSGIIEQPGRNQSL